MLQLRTILPDTLELLTSIFRALMSLTYFDDAEQLLMPTMFIDDSWEQMKDVIVAAVNEYQAKL